jgi:putative Holliday junction resolvase
MRILAVDPGEKNIGLAISDPNALFARPLMVLSHVSRAQDAVEIGRLAVEHDVAEIIVGQALDLDGQPTFEGRRSARLAAAIRQVVSVPVRLWDESGSTRIARRVQIQRGVSQSQRRGHLDEIAAAVILQDYLDAQSSRRSTHPPDRPTRD